MYGGGAPKGELCNKVCKYVSPVGRGYELDGWPTANIVLKVHTLFFLFFFFAYYVVLLLTVYWKADLALFLRLDLEKE